MNRNHHFRASALCLSLLLAAVGLTGCNKVPPEGQNTSVESTPSPTPGPTSTPTPTPVITVDGIDFTDAEEFGSAPVFSEDNSFLDKGVLLQIHTDSPAAVYYTTNGKEPDPDTGKYYTGNIRLDPTEGNYPVALTIRAKAFYPDGTVSPTAIRTYFVSDGITGRFQKEATEHFYIVSLNGDPADFTGSPDGILFGKNYEKRGDESEVPVHVEIFDSTGARLVAQFAGARVYGAYSRQNSVKSLKLIARKAYGSDLGKFHFDFFGSSDSAGNPIDSYDRFVLRNYGNDWQFGYIRDELNQRLMALAGFPTTEAVVPAVVYLNGTFYNFVWMHESYCDTYFHKLFPEEDRKGEFVVIGGTERHKDPDADQNDTKEVQEFNDGYSAFLKLDLTDDTNYRSLCEFMDVENYLTYLAANIYTSNHDWPHNNYKCFRYYPKREEKPGEGVYDGRWRFLPHDMDYTYNIYQNGECGPEKNDLKELLSATNNRRAPLFTALMQRDDCRSFFITKMLELADGAFSYDSIDAVITQMRAEQGCEIGYCIEALKAKGGRRSDVWTSEEYVLNSIGVIRDFAKKRKAFIVTQMAQCFEMTEEDILAYGRH